MVPPDTVQLLVHVLFVIETLEGADVRAGQDSVTSIDTLTVSRPQVAPLAII